MQFNNPSSCTARLLLSRCSARIYHKCTLAENSTWMWWKEQRVHKMHKSKRTTLLIHPIFKDWESNPKFVGFSRVKIYLNCSQEVFSIEDMRKWWSQTRISKNVNLTVFQFKILGKSTVKIPICYGHSKKKLSFAFPLCKYVPKEQRK